MKNVVVYYMHEYELKKALENIQNPIVTDGFVKGEISEVQAATLDANKIIYSYLEDTVKRESTQSNNLVFRILSPKSATKKSIARPLFRIKNLKNKKIEIVDNDFTFPAYFLIEINGPLLPEYLRMVTGNNAELLKNLSGNTYSIYIKEKDDFNNLKSLGFVSQIKYFGLNETDVIQASDYKKNDLFQRNFEENYTVKTSVNFNGEKIEKEVPAKAYDLYLHNPDDLNTVLEWLKGKEISVIGNSKFKIRILVSDGGLEALEIGTNNMIQSVVEYEPPGLHDLNVKSIIQYDYADQNSGVRLNIVDFSGENQIVGVADTGIDDTHADLTNRIHSIVSRGRPGNYSDPIGHGTHVAGIIAGDGTLSNGFIEPVKGIAHGSKLFFQSLLNDRNKIDLPVDLSELFEEAYNNGVRIHNNSWGAATQGRYTVSSVEVDDFVYNHKDMLLVFSAGNSGNSIDPNANGFIDLFSVGSPATSKNAITVGASRSSRLHGGHTGLTYGQAWGSSFPRPPISMEHVSGDENAMAAFSSRGPCDDFRFKPDVVAPGTDIVSTFSSSADLAEFCGIFPTNPNYALMCGTSMAAPVVTGIAAIVRQFFIEKLNLQKPSAALIKATIINGTRQLQSPDSNYNEPNLPNNHQGFGLIDLSLTIPNKVNDFTLFHVDEWQNPAMSLNGTGEAKKFKLEIKTDKPDIWIRVCLAYTDAPGNATQNDLNILMDYVATGEKFLGNFGAAIPYNRFPDKTNNVEIIRLKGAKAGEYTIKVIAYNLLKAPQDFALIVTTNCKSATLIQI